MNKKLEEEIIRHIFNNLGILKDISIDSKKIIDKSYLLKEKLVFDIEEQQITNDVFGCEISIAGQKNFKILVGECSSDKAIPEYCLIVHFQDSPIYGAYLCDDKDSEPLIALNVDNKGWMPCSTFLQATFLAGMEQLKDVYLNWTHCTKYENEFKLMNSFIKFHHKLYQ